MVSVELKAVDPLKDFWLSDHDVEAVVSRCLSEDHVVSAALEVVEPLKDFCFSDHGMEAVV